MNKNVLNFPVGSYVYVKDFYQHEKPKQHPRYKKAPQLVLSEWPQTLLVKNFLGQSNIVHKNNVRRCPERHAHLYKNLPMEVKMDLGCDFDVSQLNKFMEKDEVPPYFKEIQAQPEARTTRSKAKRLDDEDKIPFPFPSDDFMTMEAIDEFNSDDSEDEDFDQEPENQRVHFAEDENEV